jgi:hypothetical protein
MGQRHGAGQDGRRHDETGVGATEGLAALGSGNGRVREQRCLGVATYIVIGIRFTRERSASFPTVSIKSHRSFCIFHQIGP